MPERRSASRTSFCTRLFPDIELHDVAADIGADVPFFLEAGPKLATGDGTELAPISIPLDFWVVLVLPSGVAKTSTADVYQAFDDRARSAGFEERRTELMRVLEWRPSHL